MLQGLEKKDANPEIFAEKVLQDPGLVSEYLDGLLSKNETYRYNCFKVLNIVSEKKPALLYPFWDFFINHLRSDNHYHKMSAVLIIANLTSVDKDKKFEELFDEYYATLKSEKTITPIYTIKSSGKIVNFKPHLEKKITDILLNIESIHPGRQIELVKAAVIESFSEFFENTDDKKIIIEFVKNQINSESPKTRKTAKEFLDTFGDADQDGC